MSSDFTYWSPLEISGSSQPILRDNERDLYVEQSVGLYQGKSKILNKQKGRLYLTSQRIIYIDELNPKRESVCIENDDIKHIEYSSKFLKRSAKIIVFFKEVGQEESSVEDKGKQLNITQWQCPICGADNRYEGILNPSLRTMPACVSCGVEVDRTMVEGSIKVVLQQANIAEKKQNICPVCTFINHPQMRNCEICGARLNQFRRTSVTKDSAVKLQFETTPSDQDKGLAQLSFRKTDGALFYEALAKQLRENSIKASQNKFNKNAMSINGVPTDSVIDPDLVLSNTDINLIGITALEKSKEQQLLKNNIVMSNALSDLNKLMALAEDVEKMYQKTSRNTNSNSFLLVDREKYLNKDMFLEEIARELHEFVTSELNGDSGIIVTLVDLYALYNKSVRIGTGLISPEEMKQACEKFNQLGLKDLKLIKLNGRVLCLALQDSFDLIRTKIVQIAAMKPGVDILQVTNLLNQYEKNNWSMGVISEVLQYCVAEGDLLIDEQISGVNYYLNNHWKV